MNGWRWIAIAALVSAAGAARAELVKNGDFKKDLPFWHISPEQGYGHEPKFRVEEGSLIATGLKSVAPHYLIIRTALDIKKDARYRISFEYRGAPGGEFAVWVGEMQPMLAEPNKHFIRGKIQATPDWQKFEHEFTGRYDTDSKWYERWITESRNNKIIKGKRTEDFKNLPPRPVEGQASRSPLMFVIGGLDGEFALRNVSVVELN